ncbi:MAG: hypothetical protein QGI89_00465 [Candidatus Woesearchaeota archaeon]|jgi:hypothetical protein|nr:hypothetical protein [Candidatus Woesearchaeota archaeon]HJO01492.1 hypothetical protein [Candidatus Woesearchaeota archaeon]|tara:strand:+ start:842 stop:1033 length:192 start_codon:yes stop_codon:yes gene_type:complete
MDKNKLLLIASIIFGIIGFLHLLRSLFSWQLVIDTFSVPLYFSYAAVIVAGYLSWNMYNASKK